MQPTTLVPVPGETITADRDLTGTVDPDGEIRWDLAEHPGPSGSAFALAIILLYVPDEFPGQILLQMRGPRNSVSGWGVYSNVSGKVRLSDHVAATRTSGEGALSETAFRLAAVRELQEEVGIEIRSDALHHRDAFRFPFKDRLADCRVYSLPLDLREHGGPTGRRAARAWLKARSLRPFTRTQLVHVVAGKRANTILTDHLEKTFLPILDEVSAGHEATGARGRSTSD